MHEHGVQHTQPLNEQVGEHLSEDLVRHIAHLAQLELSQQEVLLFKKQLNDITRHFADIEALDLEGVEPLTHAVPMENIFREDVIQKGLSQEQAVASCSEVEDGKFKVPTILGEQA